MGFLSWTLLKSAPTPKGPSANGVGNGISGMWLMQDGSVLANVAPGTKLMALYPDEHGSYVNGSWIDAGDFLLEKDNYASGVLSDGRLILCGGEQTGAGLPQTESNFCEIYDYMTQTSAPVTPPPSWGSIGDSPSVILDSGAFMLGNTQGRGDQVALLDPATLTWTFGVGDSTNEQGYALMQTGDVLTVNPYLPESKRYNSEANAFVRDDDLPIPLGAGSEIGPGLSLMDGRVVWFGSSGHTCIYKPGGTGVSGKWAQASDMPVLNGDQLAAIDSCAILEPNGRVFLVSFGAHAGVIFLEYDPNADKYTMVNSPWHTDNREGIKMLLLPNGNGLVCVPHSSQPGDYVAYWYEVSFDATHAPSWAPTITSFPATANAGDTVTLAGTQLCGLSECYSFGDDNQQSEHYPMVRFVSSSGYVHYARAHDVSTRSIAPGQPGTVSVDIPGSMPPGTYCTEVVAMGIPSACATVTIKQPRISNIIVAIVALLFGGITRDGGGFAVVKGVKIPVDPGPLERVFAGLSNSLQDTLVGLSIDHLAASLNDTNAGSAIHAIVNGLDTETKQAPMSGAQSHGLSVWGSVGLAALCFALGALAALLITKAL